MSPLALPDEPRWVEAHGIAADPAGWQRDALVVGHDAARLIVVVAPTASAPETIEEVAAIATEYPQHALLVTTDEVAAVLRTTGREPVRAILHTLPDPTLLPELEGAVTLADDASLTHVPAALVDELAFARKRGPIWTAYVDGLPVSFAYAPWRSARWFDVSVDTLANARQLGLATITATAMIQHERAAGREPVWGADEGNLASLRLARRLGFQQVDEVWVAPP